MNRKHQKCEVSSQEKRRRPVLNHVDLVLERFGHPKGCRDSIGGGPLHEALHSPASHTALRIPALACHGSKCQDAARWIIPASRCKPKVALEDLVFRKKCSESDHPSTSPHGHRPASLGLATQGRMAKLNPSLLHHRSIEDSSACARC